MEGCSPCPPAGWPQGWGCPGALEGEREKGAQTLSCCVELGYRYQGTVQTLHCHTNLPEQGARGRGQGEAAAFLGTGCSHAQQSLEASSPGRGPPGCLLEVTQLQPVGGEGARLCSIQPQEPWGCGQGAGSGKRGAYPGARGSGQASSARQTSHSLSTKEEAG